MNTGATYPNTPETDAKLALKADLNAPTLVNPVVGTQAAGDNSTKGASTAFVQGAVPNGSYRVLQSLASSHTAGLVAGTYAMTFGGITIVGGGTAVIPIGIIHIAAADYPTVDGKTTKLRIRAVVEVNDVAPTGNFTFGLYPVTRPGTSGGAGVNIYTLGTVVTGSNGASFTTPAADSQNMNTSSDFAIPADGFYVMAIVTTATVAASSHVHLLAQLQMRNT